MENHSSCYFTVNICGNSSVKLLRRRTEVHISVSCCNNLSRFIIIIFIIIIIVIVIVIIIVVVVVIIVFVFAFFKKPSIKLNF